MPCCVRVATREASIASAATMAAALTSEDRLNQGHLANREIGERMGEGVLMGERHGFACRWGIRWCVGELCRNRNT